MSNPIAGLYAKEPAWLEQFPMLHQSTASVLMNSSPLHAQYKAFGEPKEEYEERTTLGQIAHSLLLGGDEIVSCDFDDWRTNASKAMREEARAAGKLPILAKKLTEAKALVAIVRDHLINRKEPIELTGNSEFTAVWKTKYGVWCAGRPDHVILKQKSAIIYDFKFCASAAKRVCENKFIEYGYDIQSAAYCEAIEAIYPDLVGRVKNIYIFIETDAPNAIRIMPLAGSMRTSGQWRWGKACEKWKECLETYGKDQPWPSYSDDGEPAECPTWALNEQLGEERLAEIEAEGGQ